MKKLTMNEDNKKYYSEEFIKGWENGVQAQYNADSQTGEWIGEEKLPDRVGYKWYRCSECGMLVDKVTNFCPNCGAKMKGGDSE